MKVSIKQGTNTHTVLASLAALCIYAVLSCFVFAHRSSFSGQSYLGAHGDPTVFMWFLSWWPYAISNHLNPFTANVLWAPGGINLSWSTCIPLSPFYFGRLPRFGVQ
jgi:hypothetical protein